MADHRLAPSWPGCFFLIEYLWPTKLNSQTGSYETFLTPAVDPVSNYINYVFMWTVLMGLISLMIVHGRRLFARRPGWHNSIAFFLALVAMMVAGLWSQMGQNVHAPGATKFYTSLFDGLMVNLDAAMFSLLAFYIASAAYRAFRVRTMEAALLMVAALVVMLGIVDFGVFLTHNIPLSSSWSFFRFEKLYMWVMNWINMPTQRAVTIGVAVGALAMAMRLWLSLERGSFFSAGVVVMDRFLHSLLTIDRRWIYLVLAIVLVWSLIIGKAVNPIVLPPTQKLYDAVEAVPAESGQPHLILLGMTFSAGTMGESANQARAIVRHLMLRHKKFAIISISEPQGAEYSRRMVTDIAKQYNYEYGKDWISFGYKIGTLAFYKSFTKDIYSIVPTDGVEAKPLRSFPIMQGIKSANDIALEIEITASASVSYWIQLVQTGDEAAPEDRLRLHRHHGDGSVSISRFRPNGRHAAGAERRGGLREVGG